MVYPQTPSHIDAVGGIHSHTPAPWVISEKET